MANTGGTDVRAVCVCVCVCVYEYNPPHLGPDRVYFNSVGLKLLHQIHLTLV